MPTKLTYNSFGTPGAQTILFLHGGGVAGWMWDPVVSRLPMFHCLVPDLPEHGRSMDVRPFSMPLAAAEAAELVREKARGEKAVVVGLSEGAQTAVQMLASAPEVFERALISSALLLPMPGAGWLNSPGLLAWAYRLSVPPFRKNEWWMRLNMRRAAAIPDEFYPQYRDNFQHIPESQFVNLILANQAFRMPENLGPVAVPTLVVVGKHEYPVMKQSARLLASKLPDAAAKMVDLGAGSSMAREHNWAMNAPDAFAQTLLAFIQGGSYPPVIQDLIG